MTLVVACALVCAALVRALAVGHTGFDLRVYRGAVQGWVNGRDLYAFGLGTHHLGFTYPPFAAFCMLPMALLPETATFVLNWLVIAGAIGFTTWTVLARLPHVTAHGRGFAMALVIPAVCALQPVRDTITFGQVDVSLAALVLADLSLLDRRSRWAGVGIGLATAVKLTPGLFIVFLLVAGLRRAAGTAVVTAAGATLAAAALAPHLSWTFWTSTLFDTSRVGTVDSASNQSAAGVLSRLGDGPHVPLYWLPLVLTIGALALVTAARMWRAGHRLAAFTMVGLAAAVASPISWVHHLWWVVPGILLVLDEGLGRRSRLLLGASLALFALFVSGLPDLVRSGPGRHLASAATFIGENVYAVTCAGLLLLIPLLSLRREPPVRLR